MENKATYSTLRVNNFQIFGHHGWYEEERIVGGTYQVDVVMHFELNTAEVNLTGTIDYEAVCSMISETLKPSFKLIEEMAHAVFYSLKNTYGQINHLEVKITKLTIPVPGLESASFTLSTFDKSLTVYA